MVAAALAPTPTEPRLDAKVTTGAGRMMAFTAENFDTDFAGPADWALMYRACGLQVIPCFMPDEVQRGVSWKRPRLSEWTTLQETLIPDATFERWYGSGGEYASRQNMGILTGRASGNVFVIDLDDQKGPSAGEWWRGVLALHNNGIEPETWRQRTGGGGRQLRPGRLCRDAELAARKRAALRMGVRLRSVRDRNSPGAGLAHRRHR